VELAESSVDPAVWNALEARIDDDDARVRVQLAFSLGEIRSPAADAALAKLIRRHGSDAELRTAWLTSIAGKEAALFRELWADDEFAASAGGAALLAELAGVAGARNDAQAAGELLGLIAGRGEASRQGALIQALARGLARAGASINEIVNRPTTSEATRRSVERLFARMAAEARDERRPVEARAAAILRMGYDPSEQATGWLEEWLSPQTPPPLQIAAVQALGLRRGEAQKVGGRLIEHWGRLSPAVRKEAVEVLLTRPAWILELLAAVEEGRVRPGEIERDKKQLLLNFPQEAVRGEARRVLGQEANTDRAKVIAQYQPALEKGGDVDRGRELFRKHCAACHQAGDVGKPVGPNLASVANKSPGDLLISILDPNREALPQYTNYTVVTDQGTTISGIIAAETATSLTLRRAEGAEDVILRSNVAELVSSGETLMPIGFEKDVTPEQMADLIEFVRTIKEAPTK
jgi:putative heme-binding domain-containing protein